MKQQSKSIPFKNVSRFYGDVEEYVGTDARLERKALAADVTVHSDAGTTVIDAVFSTPTVDWEGDLVWSAGINTDFYTGVAIWNHDLDSPPVGRVESLVVDTAGVRGKIVMALGYDVAETLSRLAQQNILRGISIGFIPKTILIPGTPKFNEFCAANGVNAAELYKNGCKRLVASCYLMEVSLTPIGCNKHALIRAVATKSLQLDDGVKKAVALDDDSAELLTELQKQLAEAKTLPLTKTIFKPLVIKAAAALLNPAAAGWAAYMRSLLKNESTLKQSLDTIWNEAAKQVQAIPVDTEPAQRATAVKDIVNSAASDADGLIKQEVSAVADAIFEGYETGYDGVTPIKDVDKAERWKAEFIGNYMNSLQPDPSKPLQAQTVDAFVNDYLRAAQANEPLPTLDMAASNAASANLASFGAHRDLLADLMKAAEAGDAVQVQATEDERLCDLCRPFIDATLSLTGASTSFPSVAQAKEQGWGHPNCRCLLVPVAAPVQEQKHYDFSRISYKRVTPTAIDTKSVLSAMRRGKLV